MKRPRWWRNLKIRVMRQPLIVERQAARGDVLLVTAVLDALRAKYPGSRIAVSTSHPEMLPGISVLPYGGPVAPNNYVMDLDMAYENRPGLHIVDAYADALEIPRPTTRRTRFARHHDSDVYAREQLYDDRWAAIHVGPHSWPGKNWPIENWAAIVMNLKQLGLKVLLLGGGAVSVNEWLGNVDLNLSGKTSVSQMGSLLAQCKLFIGLDSMPLHLAQAVGTPVVGLFGATLPEFVLTAGSPHIGVAADPRIPCAGERHRLRGVKSVTCDGACMRSINPQQVIDAISGLLGIEK
jgi:ADP-heptose:LPS heptosyltransferase